MCKKKQWTLNNRSNSGVYMQKQNDSTRNEDFKQSCVFSSQKSVSLIMTLAFIYKQLNEEFRFYQKWSGFFNFYFHITYVIHTHKQMDNVLLTDHHLNTKWPSRTSANFGLFHRYKTLIFACLSYKIYLN